VTIGPKKPCWDEIGHHLHTYKSDKNDGKLIGTVSNQGTSHIPRRVSKNVVILAGHDCILSHNISIFKPRNGLGFGDSP